MTIAHLADAFSVTADELVELGLVVCEDASSPEGAIRHGGVEDVQGGLGDRTLGGVRDAKRDGQR